MVERNQPGDCLRPPLKYTLPTQCQQLQKGYGECKKGLIDMRKRFRGNRPIAVAGQLETGAFGKGRSMEDEKLGTIEEKGYMLYAGRPYKGVRETKGDEDPDQQPNDGTEYKKPGSEEKR
jgi:cytochrome c oxidase assembly factor 5